MPTDPSLVHSVTTDGVIRCLSNLADRLEPASPENWNAIATAAQAVFRATSVAIWQRAHDTNGSLPIVCGTAGAQGDALLSPQHASAVALYLQRLSTEPTISLQAAPWSADRQVLLLDFRRRSSTYLLLAHVAADTTASQKLSLLQVARLARHVLECGPSSHGPDRPAIASSPLPLLKFHTSLDWNATAFNIVNEARELLDCDRVTLLGQRGRTFRVIAVSGQIQHDARANAVRRLEDLVRSTIAWNEPFQYPNTEPLPPQIEQPLSAYLDESPTRSLILVPLATSPDNESLVAAFPGTAHPVRATVPTRPWAALVIEDFRRPQIASSSEAITLVAQTAASALSHAREHRQIFLRPLWQALGRVFFDSRYRRHRRALFCMLLLATLAFAFYPATYRVSARGVIEPATQRHVFANVGGISKRVVVKHGTQVKAGDLLLEMTNPELAAQISELMGQIQIATRQLESLRAMRLVQPGREATQEVDRLAGEEQRVTLQLASFQTQLTLLRQQEAELTVHSPIDGVVITWDIERSLTARPIERGQRLMTVADTAGPWELTLQVADRHAGAIQSAAQRQAAANSSAPLMVSFVLGTDPRSIRHAELISLSDAAQPNESRETELQVRAAVDAASLGATVQVATEVRATVDCGKASLGYVLFHEIVDYVYSRWLLAFPAWGTRR